MGASQPTLHVSGIVVTTAAGEVHQVETALRSLAGVEVHQIDIASRRIVVVQEASCIDDEVDGMRRIQALPGVIDASLVYHHFGET